MEFIGHNISDETELRLRMPKFGNVMNLDNCDILAICEKREIIINNKLRNCTPVNGIEVSLGRMYQGIFDLLLLHPCPRYCGPFTCPISGHWNPCWKPIMNSNDSERNFQYFVTFTHSTFQACGSWTFDASTTVAKNKPRFKVDPQKTKLAGPASTWSNNIIYPCEHGQCCIQCPCNICTSCEEPCGQNCAKSPCNDCDQQCTEHKCELDRTYSKNDSFTIPFFHQTLEEVSTVDTKRLFFFGQTDPETLFIKYAGIPRSCAKCQEDLLDHEMHHSVLHYQCKFCRKSLRILRSESVGDIQLLKEKKRMDSEDNTTCAYCYKYFVNSFNRKYHEKTEHSDHEKPFKCNECTNSFSSLIGLKHHKRNHNITPNEYSCETCRKIFSAESTLKRHIKSVHCNESKEKFQCDVCDKLFTRADNLTRHTHEAHKEPSLNTQYIRQFAKPFKCDYCGSRYSRKEKLEIHIMSSHSRAAQDNFICNICFKTFTNLKNKIRHIYTIHKTISENHKCVYCNKSFGRKDNLVKHVKHIHSS